jgi:ribosome maturation factor RimP
MTTAESIRPALHDALEPTALVLEDVTVTPAGRRRVVKVLVDRDLGGLDVVTEPTDPLTLDEVADATRLVSDALDRSDAMGEQPYTLEVSSPGVGRPLTEPRHFRRNVGRLLTVHHDGEDLTGRVTSASATEVTLEVPATKSSPARTVPVPYAGVERAVVQVEFARHDDHKES